MHIQSDELHQISVKSVDVAVVYTGTIVIVRDYITRFWTKCSYFVVFQQYITRRSADYYSPFHITAMNKEKRVPGARWTARCEADNLLQDVIDGCAPCKGRRLMKIMIENFPQPIDVFNFSPEFHDVHSYDVFGTHWNNEWNARSTYNSGMVYRCSIVRRHLFRVLLCIDINSWTQFAFFFSFHRSSQITIAMIFKTRASGKSSGIRCGCFFLIRLSREQHLLC